MSIKDEIVRILNSRARQEGAAPDAGADINNLRAAIAELQDSVVKLAEEIDRDRKHQT